MNLRKSVCVRPILFGDQRLLAFLTAWSNIIQKFSGNFFSWMLQVNVRQLHLWRNEKKSFVYFGCQDVITINHKVVTQLNSPQKIAFIMELQLHFFSERPIRFLLCFLCPQHSKILTFWSSFWEFSCTKHSTSGAYFFKQPLCQ